MFGAEWLGRVQLPREHTGFEPCLAHPTYNNKLYGPYRSPEAFIDQRVPYLERVRIEYNMI